MASSEGARCFCWWVTSKLLRFPLLLSLLFSFNIYIVVTPTGHRPIGPLGTWPNPTLVQAVPWLVIYVRAVWKIMVITIQSDGILWSSIALPQLASYCQTCCKLWLKKWKEHLVQYLSIWGRGVISQAEIYCWLFFVCSIKIMCVWVDFLRKDSLDLILHRFICNYKNQNCVNILCMQFLGLLCPH